MKKVLIGLLTLASVSAFSGEMLNSVSGIYEGVQENGTICHLEAKSTWENSPDLSYSFIVSKADISQMNPGDDGDFQMHPAVAENHVRDNDTLYFDDIVIRETLFSAFDKNYFLRIQLDQSKKPTSYEYLTNRGKGKKKLKIKCMDLIKL